MRITTAFVVLLSLVAFMPPTALAQPVLSIDFDNRSSVPANPIFNRRLGEVIAVTVKSAKNLKASIDLPLYALSAPPAGSEIPKVNGRDFVVKIISCRERNKKRAAEKKVSTNVAHSLYSVKAKGIVEELAIQCPYAKLDESESTPIGWVVYVDKNDHFAIHLEEDVASNPAAYNVPIQVVDKPFANEYSAGLAFLGARDERFRLEPTSSSDQSVKRLSDGDVSYKVAAFAHYTLVTHPWFGLAAGIGTDVPNGNVAPMLGAVFSAPTLPLMNNGSIILGAAYGQRKRLKAQYEGLPTVPSAVTADSLTEQRSGVTWFFGISFGFLGSKEKFTALVPGQAATSTTSGQGTP